jgi:hypothetical protein
MIPATVMSRNSRKRAAKFPFGSNKIPAEIPADSRSTLKKAFSRSNSRNHGNIERRSAIFPPGSARVGIALHPPKVSGLRQLGFRKNQTQTG